MAQKKTRTALALIPDSKKEEGDLASPQHSAPSGNSSEETGLAPCPFCGQTPIVEPIDPHLEGGAWGSVTCKNRDCPARPHVRDDLKVSDNRGSDAYKARAIELWNRRVPLIPSGDSTSTASVFQEKKTSGTKRDAARVDHGSKEKEA